MTLPHSATNGQANLSHYLGLLLRETRGTVDPDNLAEFDDILLPAFTDLFAAIDKLEARVSALEAHNAKPPASNDTTAGEMPRIDIPWVSKTELLAYDSSEIELIRQKPDGTTIVHWYEMGRFAASKNISIAGTVHYFEQKGIVPTPEQLKELEAGWKEATREKFIVQPLPAGFDDNKDLRNAVLAAVAGTPPIEQPAPRPPSKAVKLGKLTPGQIKLLKKIDRDNREGWLCLNIDGNERRVRERLQKRNLVEFIEETSGFCRMGWRLTPAGLAALRNADEEARK